MNATALMDLVLGNLGTLVLLMVVAWALVKEVVVPGTHHREAVTRADMLREENKTLNENYITLLRQNGQMEGRIASLEGHVVSQEEEISALRKEIVALREKRHEL